MYLELHLIELARVLPMLLLISKTSEPALNDWRE